MKRSTLAVSVSALALVLFLGARANADSCTPESCHVSIQGQMCSWAYGAILVKKGQKGFESEAACKKLAQEPPTLIRELFGSGAGDDLATTSFGAMKKETGECACEAVWSSVKDAPPEM